MIKETQISFYSIPAREEIYELDQTKKYYITTFGTRLSYYEYGDKTGFPIVFFHGTGSHVHGMLLHRSALDKHFRIIAIDRPGVGCSDFRPDWTVLEFADEVAEIMHYLKISKFGAVGISGAGPSLMAMAYRHHEKLEFLVDLACAMPLYRDTVSVSELGTMDRIFARVGAHMPLWIVRVPFWLLGFSQKVLRSPKLFAWMFSSSLGRFDKEMFKNKDLRYLLDHDFVTLFKQGTKGAAYDAMTVYRPWGFALSDIKMHIDVFHGTDDLFVPLSFSKYLKAQIPQSKLNITKGAGHFYWLVNSDKLLGIIETKF